MASHAPKVEEPQSPAAAAPLRSATRHAPHFVDNRAAAVTQRRLQALADGSPQVQQAAQLQATAVAYAATQAVPRPENRTGLPDQLKTGVENLSGHSLDDVRVHYNSSAPAQLQAHAFAQGTDIHVAPGQEQHLAHEAWHVVQQKQGRVQATRQLKAGVPVNDDAGLEREADVMGEIALSHLAAKPSANAVVQNKPIASAAPPQPIVQRTIWAWNVADAKWDIFYETNDKEPPPYIGSAGDYHDNEGTLGVYDLNKQQAEQAKAHLESAKNQLSNVSNAEQTNIASAMVDTPDSSVAMAADNGPFANLTMVDILRKAFVDSGVPKRLHKDINLYNLLLDIGSEEIKKMNIDAKVQKIPEYYKSPLAYTSCHNTANKLLLRMSSTPVNPGAYHGYDKQQAEASQDNTWMAPVANALGNSIAHDASNAQRAIYEVHCGGHGFAIIVRSGSIEIVQSFANAVALVERMERGPLIVPVSSIVTLTNDLGSDARPDRDKAAEFIAQCDADTFGLIPSPASWQYRWRRNALKSDETIIEEFRSDIKASFNAIKGILQK